MGVHRHPIVYCQLGSGGNFQIWDGARTNKDKIGFDRPTVRPSVRRTAATRQAEPWVDRKLIKPVNPSLFQMHIWAVTQHYADYDAQIRFMFEVEDNDEPDLELIVDHHLVFAWMWLGLIKTISMDASATSPH